MKALLAALNVSYLSDGDGGKEREGDRGCLSGRQQRIIPVLWVGPRLILAYLMVDRAREGTELRNMHV